MAKEAAAGAMHSEYPQTFSADLIRHCDSGCIPAEVFSDALALLNTENRRRYLRINPRSEKRVLDAGACSGCGMQTPFHTSPLGLSNGLSPGERRVVNTVEAATQAAAQGEPRDSRDESIAHKAGTQRVCDIASRANMLRVGLAEVTGLPLESVEAVAWMPCGVFSLPWSYAMGRNPLFLDGTLLPMDAASIAAVVALRPRQGDRVLDLCCAPGMKLGLLTDAVARSNTTAASSEWHRVSPSPTDGLVVGVDLSLSRLYRTRSTLKKQQQAQSSTDSHSPLPVCLFAGDGCSFSMSSAASALDLTGASVDAATGLTAVERRRLQRLGDRTATSAGWKRGRLHSEATASSGSHETLSTSPPSVVYASTHTRSVVAAWLQEKACVFPRTCSLTTSSPLPEPLLFDRVLIDAECSHDGSVAHMQLIRPPVNITDAKGTSSPHAREAPSAASAAWKSGDFDNAYRMQHMNLGDVSERVASLANEEAASLSPQSATHCLSGSDANSQGDALPASSASLMDLQLRLLDNGYRQLRPGGTLVYSTCSYSYLQNEFVVRRFLERVNGVAGEAEACGDHHRCSCNDTPGKDTAVLVSAFSYEHEADDDGVALCVRMDSEEQRREVQRLLDLHAFDYGIVERGQKKYAAADGSGCNTSLEKGNAVCGSRFWPRVFQSSFLYVAKIWKKPLQATKSSERVGVKDVVRDQ